MATFLDRDTLVAQLEYARQQVSWLSQGANPENSRLHLFWARSDEVLAQAAQVVRVRPDRPLLERSEDDVSLEPFLEALALLARDPEVSRENATILWAAAAVVAVLGSDIFDALRYLEPLLRRAPHPLNWIASFFEYSLPCDARDALHQILAEDAALRDALLAPDAHPDARVERLVRAAAERDLRAWYAAWDA